MSKRLDAYFEPEAGDGGSWIEGMAVACNFCPATVPETGGLDEYDHAMAEALAGWTAFCGLDICQACRSDMYAEVRGDGPGS